MNKRRRRAFYAALALGTVAFSLVFALAFREDMDRYFARPLLEAYVIARWFVAQFHQGLLWGALVLAAGYFALRSHFDLARAVPRHLPRHRQGRRKTSTELDRLAGAVRRASFHPMARARLMHELSATAALLVANREGVPREVARQRVTEGTWGENEQVATFLSATPRRRGLGGLERDFHAKLETTLVYLDHYAKGV